MNNAIFAIITYHKIGNPKISFVKFEVTSCEKELRVLNIEEIKDIIVERLKPLNPYQIILFGSYAYGTPTKDSDLDICIIDKGEVSKRERKSKIRMSLFQ